ncbi:transposase [Micromonospora sp. SL4-19]|uniref:transposase n=1 Tax=Micromonospora sp. SL4-19 TaxID=3399129 RepID=UPI003A4DC165
MRLRATYTRDQGVRHMIAALDLATGRLHYRIRDRKRWREFLSFLKVLRRRWPEQRLYLIVDNFSPHKHPEVRACCAANRIDLVFLPTYASWLNWIEVEFAAVLVPDATSRMGRAAIRGCLAEAPPRATVPSESATLSTCSPRCKRLGDLARSSGAPAHL